MSMLTDLLAVQQRPDPGLEDVGKVGVLLGDGVQAGAAAVVAVVAGREDEEEGGAQREEDQELRYNLL